MAERARLKRSAGGGNYFANPKAGINFIHTGCTTLDLALGGGWARGRVGNVIGDKSTGKSLLMIEASANFVFEDPKQKRKVRYRETEAAFDKPYAGALGMPLESVDFGPDKIDTVEDLFEDMEKIIDGARGPELIIVDSLDALTDRAELKRKVDEGTFGAAKAKLLSQLFRRLVRKQERKDVTLLIVSQIRDNIGVTMPGARKWKRSGGHALDFYASQVLVLAQKQKLTKTIGGIKRPVGIAVKAKVDKNKIALAYREAEFDLLFGYGIDDVQACIDWLDEIKHLKDGIGDMKLSRFIQAIEEGAPGAPEMMERLREAVRSNWYRIENEFMPKRRKYG